MWRIMIFSHTEWVSVIIYSNHPVSIVVGVVGLVVVTVVGVFIMNFFIIKIIYCNGYYCYAWKIDTGVNKRKLLINILIFLPFQTSFQKI